MTRKNDKQEIYTLKITNSKMSLGRMTINKMTVAEWHCGAK
jgi:hypothetical protein